MDYLQCVFTYELLRDELCTSFMMERTSVSLNVVLGEVCDKSDSQTLASEDLQPTFPVFCIPEDVTHLHSGFLKGLEHSNGSSTVSLSLPYNLRLPISSIVSVLAK